MRRIDLKIWLPLAAFVLLILLMMPRSPKLRIDYRKGSAWNKETLVAMFDFPILKTEEQIVEEKMNSSFPVIPYYRWSEEVVNKALRKVESIPADNSFRVRVQQTLKKMYQTGILPDAVPEIGKDYELSQDFIYVQKSKRATKLPAQDVIRLSDAKGKLLAEVQNDSLLKVTGAYDLIVPNLLFDKQTTLLVHSETEEEVSPTMGYVSAGQIIVSEGEIVTAEIAQTLDSYLKEYETNVGSFSGAAYFAGGLIEGIVVILLLYAGIYFIDPKIFKDTKRYYYLLLIFGLNMFATMLFVRFGEDYILLFPFTLSALLLQSFFRNRVIFSTFVFSLLPLLLFAKNGVAIFVMYLAAGTVAIYTFKFFSRGWKQFLTALISFAMCALIYLGFYLLGELTTGSVIWDLVELFIGSMLAVAGFPLVYLFEKIFDLVSHQRLEELCNPSQPLLHQLEIKAPGSFQHSLQVMNMADAAARAIGADEQMVRAGAMYHDIGKMTNPLCFVENENLLVEGEGTRYHAKISPLQSAQAILRHVSDGVEMARRHHLPGVIVDFIKTHHGTTSVQYFLSKYLAEGGDPANAGEFSYEGPAPATKEQIILMLADALEASSRTLKEYTPESYSKLVEKIVGDKMEAGQFNNADITVREIGTVKETFKSYLAQLYHERIVYPEKSNSNIL